MNAAATALGLVFQTANSVEPVIGVVIAVDMRNTEFLAIADIFRLAHLVFLCRMDIRVVEIHRDIDAGGLDRSQHFAGTGRAAGMHEQLGIGLRRLEFGPLVIVEAVTIHGDWRSDAIIGAIVRL